MMPATVAPTRETRLTGVSTREVWAFEIVDPAVIPREYLLVDEGKIRKIVAALKAETNILGVRVYRDTTVASRAA